MKSNIDISRITLDRFNIQKHYKTLEYMLKRLNDNESIIFFEFKHIDNRLKCRLAFSSLDKKLDYETHLDFDFRSSNPIKVSYYGSYNDGIRPRKNGFITEESLWGLTELDVDTLVDILLQKR